MANTDQSNSAGKGAISKVLGLRGKTAATALTPLSDEELHDEAVVHALTGTRQLRKDLNEWKHKAEALAAELASVKHEAASEIMTSKHEYESKLMGVRADNDALRKQLQETGLKLEHFERLSFELNAKCEDIEKFYLNELRTMHDSGQHVATSLASAINNATTGLNDAAQHASEGLLKQMRNSAENMKGFIGDLKKRRQIGEYRPRLKPQPDGRAESEKMSPEAESELASLVAKLKPEPMPPSETPEGDQQ